MTNPATVRPSPRVLPLAPALLAPLLWAPLADAQSWLPDSPFPRWGTAPAVTIPLAYDGSLSATQNGARLSAAIGALQPGQTLAIGAGTWSVPTRLDLHGAGTAAAPFRLCAADPAHRPVITRPDANQNVINMGSNAPARFWVLQDLELTGGSDLLRLYDCADVWIDGCWLHDGGGIGIAANTVDTARLWLTRNEIARPGPGTTGEGMYLGANFGAVATSFSVIAYNLVHDTRAAVAGQGDGIELKQGSHHCWIVGNDVHDTKNPCILVYGTGGNDTNVVENNLCYDSDDGSMQVQGEAIVRNNVVINTGTGFQSHDHQGATSDLAFVHNTVVSSGTAALLENWGGRPGMTFANNVAYSLGAESLHFGNGDAGVVMAGNVIVGPRNGGSGCLPGNGLGDFVGVGLAPFRTDATPVVGGAIDNRGAPAFALPRDAAGTLRMLPADPGAIANRATFAGDAAQISVATGGTLSLIFDAPPLANADFHVLGSVTGTTPGVRLGPFTLPLEDDGWLEITLRQGNTGGLHNTVGTLDAAGRTRVQLVFPPLPPVLRGLVASHALVALRGTQVLFVSNPVNVTFR